MILHKSGEDYLEAILLLHQKNACVRSIDVANYFGYSKASVSHAVSLLQKGGFITVGGDKTLALTSLGEEEARRIYERHHILSELLIALGVPAEIAAQDACSIEHVISQESFARIKAFFLSSGEHLFSQLSHTPANQQT